MSRISEVEKFTRIIEGSIEKVCAGAVLAAYEAALACCDANNIPKYDSNILQLMLENARAFLKESDEQ